MFQLPQVPPANYRKLRARMNCELYYELESTTTIARHNPPYSRRNTVSAGIWGIMPRDSCCRLKLIIKFTIHPGPQLSVIGRRHLWKLKHKIAVRSSRLASSSKISHSVLKVRVCW